MLIYIIILSHLFILMFLNHSCFISLNSHILFIRRLQFTHKQSAIIM
nr:MAG TPA: hypothetical protein [Caudoviricetes sp.]